MRKIIFIAVLVMIMTGCSTNKKSKGAQYLWKWQLVEMYSNMAGPANVSTGEDMAWQEFYILKKDDTFIKSREQNGVLKEAKGTYSIKELSDGKYLELTYESDNALIGNCTATPKELLFFSSETTLSGTWQACDGPGLVYKRVE